MTTETFRRADHRPVPTSAHEAEASAVALRAPSEASASCCFPLDITHSPSRRRLSKEIVGRGSRSTETLWPFLGECLAHFSPDECRNYFRHCWYAAATRS